MDCLELESKFGGNNIINIKTIGTIKPNGTEFVDIISTCQVCHTVKIKYEELKNILEKNHHIIIINKQTDLPF